jgi:hypothetical protein
MLAASVTYEAHIKHLVYKGACMRALSKTCSATAAQILYLEVRAAPTQAATGAGESAAVCARRRGTAGWRVGSRTGVCRAGCRSSVTAGSEGSEDTQ